VKRQAVTGLAARARLAEDGAAHHLPLAVDIEADCLLLLQFLSRRLRLQSAAPAAAEPFRGHLFCAGLCPRQNERREQHPHKGAD
jgi:hypothetical protein